MLEEDVTKMLENIKTILGSDCNISDEIIKYFIDMYSQLVCNETCYRKLPKEFYPYVFNATIESCQRIGNEGMISRSELGTGTSYSYKDIEESIRTKVRGKKNPRAYLGYWS